jgi:hypothetical protein
MVTIGFFLVFILLTSLVIGINIFTYFYSLFDAWGTLFYSDMLVGRIIVFSEMVIGFLSAIMIDTRIMKKKRKK